MTLLHPPQEVETQAKAGESFPHCNFLDLCVCVCVCVSADEDGRHGYTGVDVQLCLPDSGTDLFCVHPRGPT
jgi:hypothetical protein